MCAGLVSSSSRSLVARASCLVATVAPWPDAAFSPGGPQIRLSCSRSIRRNQRRS